MTSTARSIRRHLALLLVAVVLVISVMLAAARYGDVRPHAMAAVEERVELLADQIAVGVDSSGVRLLLEHFALAEISQSVMDLVDSNSALVMADAPMFARPPTNTGVA